MKNFVCLALLVLTNFLNAQLVFQERPEDFQPKVEVAACYIKVDDHFLFLKRPPHKINGDTWGIPGGKLEKDETAREAVIREIHEETGIDLSKMSVKFLSTVYVRHPRSDFVYHMFEVSMQEYPAKVVISPLEHTEYQWMTLQEALQLSLIPGEDECICLTYPESP